jgi:hypothetical protein
VRRTRSPAGTEKCPPTIAAEGDEVEITVTAIALEAGRHGHKVYANGPIGEKRAALFVDSHTSKRGWCGAPMVGVKRLRSKVCVGHPPSQA